MVDNDDVATATCVSQFGFAAFYGRPITPAVRAYFMFDLEMRSHVEDVSARYGGSSMARDDCCHIGRVDW